MGSVTSNLNVLRVHISQSVILRQRWVHQVISQSPAFSRWNAWIDVSRGTGYARIAEAGWTLRAAVDHQSGMKLSR